MKMIDSKGKLHDPHVLSILSHSQYLPTAEKLQSLADSYESNPNLHAFSCVENGGIVGVIVLERRGTAAKIVSIAVEPACRGRGIGSGLISYAAGVLKCGEICAETDDDAVGFYRRCGFEVVSLGEKYPGIIRYWCALSLS